MNNSKPHEFVQFASNMPDDCAECVLDREDPIHGGTSKCRYCGHEIFLVEILGGPLNGKESFWFSDATPDCEDHSPDGEHRPEESDTMSSTMSDVERAEMMLSLGMNEQGEALSNEERETLTQFVTDAKGQEAPAQGESSTEAAAPNDIQAMIQAEIKKALGGTAPQAGAPISFDEVLKQIDPRDSETALAMFQWLCDNKRMQVVGSLNGGGYLLHYQEPKGTTKEGYTPGATQGGRMVDQAVEKAKASGAKPRQTGMCDKCWSAVEKQDDGVIVLDGSTDVAGAVCSAGGAHTFNA